MSTPKMIFTYKRKRLSSRSGVEHDDACPDSPLDVHTGIQQADPKDPMFQVRRSDVCNLTNMQQRSTELSEDNKCKELVPPSENVSTEGTLQEHRMMAPLITFTRRLKRKVDVGTKAVEKSSTLEVETDRVTTGNMSCQNSEKLLIKESEESSHFSTRSSAEIPVLRETVDQKCSLDDLVLDTSSGTKQSSSTLSGLDVMETANPPKNSVSRSSDGDSQLTSSSCSDLHQRASPASLDLSCPPSVACPIDCNVIPEPLDPQMEESETIQHSSAIPESCGNITQEGHLNRKELQLFGDTDMKDVDSPSFGVLRLHDDPHVPVATNKKPETLQLFPGNGPSTNLESDSRRPHQYTTYSSVCVSNLEQTPPVLGLSLAMKPVYEAQTSGIGSSMHLFQDHNVRTRGFCQNPNVRPNSLGRLQPVWSEEELDALWVGVRRHGLGNWHGMLVDPKLRFAPWRVARHLADQWEQEEPKIWSSQSERRLIPKGQLGAFIMRHTFADMPAQQPHRLGNYNSTPFNSMGLGPSRHLNNYKFPGTKLQPPNGVAGPSMRKRCTPENVIVIDSDPSSEETVSDDHIIRT